MTFTPPVLDWLTRKQILPAAAESAGALCSGEVIIYPYPCGERTVWKHRRVTGGKPWYEPKGMWQSPDLLPFCAKPASDHAHTVIFCEGESDALRIASLIQHSTVAVYCIPGSSTFRAQWLDLAIGTDHYLFPDTDEAGEMLARKVAGYLPDLKVARLPFGDCCDHDDATILLALEAAQPLPLSEVTIPKPVRATGRRTDYAHALVAEAERDGVVLHQRGDELTGLCPFHPDSTPSLSINEAKGLFHCFGCNAGGSAVDWVMQRTNTDFVTARNYLRSRYA